MSNHHFSNDNEHKCVKSFVFFSIILLCINITFAQTKTQKDLIRLYIDESRSYYAGWALWKKLNREDDFQKTISKDILDYEYLKIYDVVFICNIIESLPYYKSELDAVERFVREGGGLLLIGCAERCGDRPRPQRYKNRWISIKALSPNTFSTNSIALLFGVSFSNLTERSKPYFNLSSELKSGCDLSTVSFDQPIGYLFFSNPNMLVLASNKNGPSVVCFNYGKGRVIIAAMERLFFPYGNWTERKLGKTDDIITTQKDLLKNWLCWLASNRDSQKNKEVKIPPLIMPRVTIEHEMATFRCIPQLKKRTEEIIKLWDVAWKELSNYTGVSSPMEFAPSGSKNKKLLVYMRAQTGGGGASASTIGIAALGEDWKVLALFGHEVGHKLIGGPSRGISEGFAQWLNFRVQRATGYSENANKEFKETIREFVKIDPTRQNLNILDEMSNIKHPRACIGKWLWVINQLEYKYGEDFLKKYIVSLRNGVQMDGSHSKIENGKRVKISFSDIVYHMSQAAGEDLKPWFESLGFQENK